MSAKRPLKYVLLLVAAHIVGLGGYGYYLASGDGKSDSVFAKVFRGMGVGAKPAAKDKVAKPVPVLLAQVESGDIEIWLEGNATVHAFNTVTVRPRVSGIIDSIKFTEGQRVAKGDVLALIDPRPYKAVLEQAKAKLAQAQAKKLQDQALLGNARSELDRVRGLVKLAGESQRALDSQQALVAQLEAATAEDQAAIEAAAAAIEAANLDLDYTVVRSPLDGVTGIRQIDAGNTVTANQTEGIIVVTQTQPVSVVLSLAQRYLSAIRPHLQPGKKPPVVQAVMYNYADDGVFSDTEKLGEGTLNIMDNQVDTASDNLRLKATFENKDGALWPGQYVIARVLTETRKNAVTVPAAAVQEGIDSSFVYVVKADKTVEARPVRTGQQINGRYIIEKGLQPGETVVREGQNKLKPGLSVAVMTEQPAGAGVAPVPAVPAAAK
ncbi:MAG: efflux RND transporter periplasmic adaptor subunit [Puniceicoccales bacterium]|jgi:multidrug efflux system membrane fusion protein|nr:efflux RND transporter periplasmic adaptor subunit [Puniceicoccales bacterium]